MLDIVCLGHATLDLFLKLDPAEAPVVWSEKRKDSYLCLDFDDKSAVTDLVWSPGGNALNGGIGFHRLGLKTRVVTELGGDFWGEKVRQVLDEEGLDLEFVAMRDGEQTDLSVILVLKGERTILSYHHPRDYHWPTDLSESRWVYLTSLGHKFPALHQRLLQWMTDSEDVKLAYNPGTYELKAGVEASEEVLQKTDILIVNREEGGELVGRRPSEVDQSLTRDLLGLGPETVVVTDGAKGAFADDGESFYEQAALEVEAVEKTGAGDSFSAGFLAATIHGRSPDEALKWGVVNGASVIGYFGATRGLLRKEQMEERVELL